MLEVEETETMKMTTWFEEYHRLKQRATCPNIGVDPLSDEEWGLRRLPIQAVNTLEAVFQPRQMTGDEATSGKHLGELRRVLREQGSLDPITVLKVGGEWFCIDGHHRLEAYRQSGGRRTHIPVKIFNGTLADALQASIEVNAPDKLNLTHEDKLEAAWKLVLLGVASVSQISTTTTIAERSVQRMRRGLERVRALHPSQPFETWTWARVKELLRGELKEGNTMWQDVKAKEWARQLAKTFCGLPSEHPQIFAQALLRYNADTAKAIAEEVLRASQRTTCEAGKEADF